VETARRAMGINVEPQWGSMPNRKWDTNVWVADNRKICNALGWRPRHTFEQGFHSMLNWFRDNSSICDLYRARLQEAM